MKNVLETKKLENAIEILKSELNQRDLLIQNQRFQYEEQIEELKEKLAEMKYQRQILETKLDSQLQVCLYLWTSDVQLRKTFTRFSLSNRTGRPRSEQ